MKVALLLTGLHYQNKIDFRFYIKNIKEYIYPLGEIDTFLFTNNSEIQDELSVYSPKFVEFMKDTPNRRISKTVRALNFMKKYKHSDSGSDSEYDFICITRIEG